MKQVESTGDRKKESYKGEEKRKDSQAGRKNTECQWVSTYLNQNRGNGMVVKCQSECGSSDA